MRVVCGCVVWVVRGWMAAIGFGRRVMVAAVGFGGAMAVGIGFGRRCRTRLAD